jgi:hypothetical protein
MLCFWCRDCSAVFRRGQRADQPALALAQPAIELGEGLWEAEAQVAVLRPDRRSGERPEADQRRDRDGDDERSADASGDPVPLQSLGPGRYRDPEQDAEEGDEDQEVRADEEIRRSDDEKDHDGRAGDVARVPTWSARGVRAIGHV